MFVVISQLISKINIWMVLVLVRAAYQVLEALWLLLRIQGRF